MEYAVSRDGTALVTLHGGSETTARDEARSNVAASLESLATTGELADWEIASTSVHEHPTAPFEPYTFAISFRVAVTVDAADPTNAAERGVGAIDDALASAGIESVEYTSSASTSAV